jgi:hypothetical protein
MTKPGADRAAVESMLATSYTILDSSDLHLQAADGRRLYPDAYGRDYVARQENFLTEGPVRAHLLLSHPQERSAGAHLAGRVKTEIRRNLGPGDLLRNHVHLPDNPGDAFCDIEHLFGRPHLLYLFERYERDTAPVRLAGYRALLEGR